MTSSIPAINQEHVARYKDKQFARIPKWQSLINSLKKNDEFSALLKFGKCYEFQWGFIIEQGNDNLLSVTFYPAQAIERGVDALQERFLTAFVEIIRPDIKIFNQIGDFEANSSCKVLFQDGRSSMSAFSLAALGDDHGLERFRNWIAHRILSDLWFQALERVMDASFEFKNNKYFTNNKADPNTFHSF